MANASRLFWGIDCGSTEIKVVVCDEAGKVLERRRRRTLFPLMEHVRAALKGENGGLSPFDADGKVAPGNVLTATGYGRNHIEFVPHRLTEIKAHCLGVERELALTEPYTIIDIGGQDSKVVMVKGREVSHFVINRKCAAGTGAYVEELAHRLEIPLERMSDLSGAHDKRLSLSSYCTVFAGQEVIKILMEGERVENLLHALYESVVQRVMEMTAISTATVVFSGGVLSHHPALREAFEARLKDRKFHLAPNAQFCGALGAAVQGMAVGSG